LIVDAEATHYKRMRSSIYLYLFFLLHADRRTGTLLRRLPTIAAETGINVHTLRQWLAILRREGYVTTEFTGRALRIRIQRWKALPGTRNQSLPPRQSITNSASLPYSDRR
jgi:DNA-binding transcriptional regulator YhcF (GntR family)